MENNKKIVKIENHIIHKIGYIVFLLDKKKIYTNKNVVINNFYLKIICKEDELIN